jgi:hypothetical protein
MPFPGPAKEQRTTHHIIQVGNDEKKFQRKGKDSRTNERNFFFLLEQQLYGPKLRARHTNLDRKKSQREAKETKTPACAPAGDDMDRQRREGVKGEDSFFFFPKCKQGCLFYSKFFYMLKLSFFFLFLSMEQGMGEESMCVCVACA